MNRKTKMSDIDLSAVVSALNNKADVGLENSDKASVIEQLAQSGLNASEAALNVANAANTLIETSLPQKFDKTGGTIAGNTIVDGNLTVTGEINATISGSSESATSATKDSNGNVIVDTYLKKKEDIIIGTIKQSVGNVITASTNSNFTALLGGLDTGVENLNGGSITLFGKDYSGDNPGGFCLRAADGTNGTNFTGYADGVLLWGSNPMEQYVSVDLGEGRGTVRYTSGLQLCWINQLQGTWTFYKAFSRRPCVVVTPNHSSTNLGSHVTSITNTSCNFGFSGVVSGEAFAIGFWK